MLYCKLTGIIFIQQNLPKCLIPLILQQFDDIYSLYYLCQGGYAFGTVCLSVTSRITLNGPNYFHLVAGSSTGCARTHYILECILAK